MDALNQGISEARSNYYIRMDADDVMEPSRLRKQVEHLARVDISCCQVQPIGFVGAGREAYFAWQNGVLTAKEFYVNRYVECPFQHPTLALPVKVLQDLGGYRKGPFPEDYDLFLRIMQAGLRMEKLPGALLQYRCSEDQLSYIDSRYSKSSFHDLRKFYIAADESLQEILHLRPLVVWGASRMSRRRFEAHFPEAKPDYFVDIKPSLLAHPGDSRSANLEETLPVEKTTGHENSSKKAKLLGSRKMKVCSPEELFQDRRNPFVLVYVNARGARPVIELALAKNGIRAGLDYLCIG